MMPTSIDEYFRDLLDQIAGSAIVRASDLNFDKRSSMVGFIRGQIYLVNDTILHLRELIDLRKSPVQVMYVYHYQSQSGELIFRYDNTPHHNDLPTFPHHKHTADGIEAVPSGPPVINDLLSEIGTRIL